MRALPFLFFISVFMASCQRPEEKPLPSFDAIKGRALVDKTMNNWHKAAAHADFDGYFSLMTADAVFAGTDATEYWNKSDFMDFAKPYFDKGRGWAYTPLSRNIYFSRNGNTAWMDELLSSKYKICRGSAVLILMNNGEYKIAQYILSLTVPNAVADSVVRMKAAIEDSLMGSWQP